jgi:hypothetical protein
MVGKVQQPLRGFLVEIEDVLHNAREQELAHKLPRAEHKLI